MTVTQQPDNIQQLLVDRCITCGKKQSDELKLRRDMTRCSNCNFDTLPAPWNDTEPEEEPEPPSAEPCPHCGGTRFRVHLHEVAHQQRPGSGPPPTLRAPHIVEADADNWDYDYPDEGGWYVVDSDLEYQPHAYFRVERIDCRGCDREVTTSLRDYIGM